MGLRSTHDKKYESKLQEMEEISEEIREYSKRDWEKPAYKSGMAKFRALAKEAFECEERLKEMFEV